MKFRIRQLTPKISFSQPLFFLFNVETLLNWPFFRLTLRNLSQIHFLCSVNEWSYIYNQCHVHVFYETNEENYVYSRGIARVISISRDTLPSLLFTLDGYNTLFLRILCGDFEEICFYSTFPSTSKRDSIRIHKRCLTVESFRNIFQSSVETFYLMPEHRTGSMDNSDVWL